MQTERITAIWEKRIAELGAAQPGLAVFLNRAIHSADNEDLELYSRPELEDLLTRTANHIGERKAGQADIRIWAPQSGPEATTVVDIYSADTPFIVDSALAAIRAAGASIRFMVHPLVPVDISTTPWTILERPAPDSRNESILHVHIETPADQSVLEDIETELAQTMVQVRQAVVDWRDMLERLRGVVLAYREHPPHMREPLLAEAIHFLAWLADHNFTFLGMREYRLTGEGETRRLEPVDGSGLGILADPDYHYLRQGPDFVHTTAQHLDFIASDDALLITKANRRALVHRRVHMDYVGVKLFDEDGRTTGELRILGLFTSMSIATPHTEVPVIRRKVTEVMRRSGLDPRSHAGKALMNAIDNYPREEMFQITEAQLLEFASVISTLPDRPRVRVLPRIDRFDNFVSILVYLPRDRFDSSVRARIGAHMAARYDGRVSAFSPGFPEGELARVHFIIGRNGGETPRPEREVLEAEVTEISRTFGDRLLDAAPDAALAAPYAQAFSADYQLAHTHDDALADIAVLEGLTDQSPLAVTLAPGRETAGTLSLNVYHRERPIPLSDRVPMLEHFGFKVIDERTYRIHPTGAAEAFIHNMTLVPAADIDLEASAGTIEAAIIAAARGEIESDGYNGLVVTAGLAHHRVVVLRALGHYLKQLGIAYSQRYIWTALASHPSLAHAFLRLFETLNDPDHKGDREAEAEALRDEIATRLDTIVSIDEDKILRRVLDLLEALVRTNFYQRDPDGRPAPTLALKFDPARIEAMPEPRPYREIFVYAPRVEGVHMRGGAIARGGLRWSDRPEDFRTEVLGLVKAQMVKNSVIVPVGAKGGFVPRQMPAGADREAVYAEGTACYKLFVSALLDVTDNLAQDTVIPPENVLRRDGDDPYLVVAADKGTASFSDTANAISTARDYWLGDAFASGGSAGYDHKKMGITARGGWEAVKRHFREMDIDIQTQDFTVAGIGDMSGDVFGNAMLLSPHIRLLAAFDHRDIFIDPDPDTARSFAERRRLFEMGRSSWADYDKALISEGGGVFSRQSKSIPLSAQAQELLGLSGPSATPTEIMTAILKARVDLFWFGGIGTYVRASIESDADAGDRTNDSIRITGLELGARVVGEGANLGLTQRGRIEYALAGGRINTDAIDNSAGVNSSDLEVNIKIALAEPVRTGALPMADRDALLVEMTEQVAALCLRNNYLQTLALSLTERRGPSGTPDLADLMAALEQDGELDRTIEFLPDAEALAERTASGKPLTRPELAVLLAYAKNTLYAALLDSEVPDDPYLSRELYRYFPATLRERFPESVESHRLRREVIATVLSNAMINRGGPAFVIRLNAMTSTDPGALAFAYAAARDTFDIQDLNAEVDALDGRIASDTQLALYGEIERLQVTQALWFLRNETFSGGLSDLVARYRDGAGVLRGAIGTLASPFLSGAIAAQERKFEAGGTPPDLARRIARLSVLALTSDIVLVAGKAGCPVEETAKAFFSLIETFRLGRLTEQGAAITAVDRFDRMALDRAMANLTRALRDLTRDVLAADKGPITDRLAAWRSSREGSIARVARTVADLIEGDLSISRLSVAAGLLTDLATS
ncbi:NAD-glutamate dehydrogenase [Pelagibacterium montanilacus]|uniref:NAD-glutamate dehydrogenase n=1 Tax=Pelagibacterium montanilacus TaxID=2185280 RepID=UPI000F8D97AF|nr:NAD-glutamate dehydrogenase [Pelagibacterium montanilacus]